MLLLFIGLAGSWLEKRMAVDEASTLNFTGFGTACPTPVTHVIFTEKAASQNSNRKWVEHEMAQFGIGLEPALSQLSQKHSKAPGCQVKVPALLPRSPFSFAPSSTIQHRPAPSAWSCGRTKCQENHTGRFHQKVQPFVSKSSTMETHHAINPCVGALDLLISLHTVSQRRDRFKPCG